MKERYNQYMRAIAKRPGLWEVNGETREFVSVTNQNGNMIGGSTGRQTILYARAGETSTGYAVSQKLDEEPEALLNRAAENGACLTDSKAAISQQAVKSYEEELVSTPAAELKTAVHRVEEALPADQGPVTVTETIHTQWVVNQKGVNRQYSRRCFEVEVVGTGRSYTDIVSELDQVSADRLLPELLEERLNQKPAGSCEAGIYPAVLSSYVMAKFWVTGWQLFSGRQYAAGTGALAGHLHEKVAADCVTIQDFPALPEAGYSLPFDCEGSEGKPVDLIRRGEFCGLLQNLESAAALGMEPTGNAGRTEGLVKGDDILVTPRNFVLQPGEEEVDSLLQDMRDGLYVFDAWDELHAVNTASGDFSFPCSAVLIWDGRRQAVVKGMTMNGNLRELLRSVKKMGNRLCYMPQLMHKTYLVAAPAVLVSGVNVSGSELK